MTSSPILTPHSRMMSHSPSPSASPKLVPVASTMASSKPIALPSPSLPSSSATSSSLPSRSYARAPQPRPYATSRAKAVDGDTKKFAELVADMVHERASNKRKGELIEMIENVSLDDVRPYTVAAGSPAVNVNSPHRTRSMAASVSGGSWEHERAELIVDIPVWSPGCFQDLSTLHALRDTTLSHTHALLNHLHNAHSVPATYRLLARSCVTSGAHLPPYSHGWGCIRLAPSSMPVSAAAKPKIRRTSFVHSHSLPQVPTLKSKAKHGEHCHDSAVLDSDDEEDVEVRLKDGYSGSVSSDSEDEDESADSVVSREIMKRGGKEGMAFLMILFGQPAIILT